MPNNLGREEIWNHDQNIWASIDEAVKTEVGRIRIAQKVFDGAESNNGQYVPADIISRNSDVKAAKIEEGKTKAFLEISFEFLLTQGQVDDEATLRTGRTLAKHAAKSIAFAEDVLFFQGANSGAIPDGVEVSNEDSAGNGILEGIQAIDVDPLDKKTADRKAGILYGKETFQAVTEGISELTGRQHPGPYALFLRPAIYADAYAPIGGTLTTTGDRLVPLLERGFYATGALPDSVGLLVSLGGEPTTLYVGQDAVTEYDEKTRYGHLFRMFERVQIVARDPGAFVGLIFTAGETEQASGPAQAQVAPQSP